MEFLLKLVVGWREVAVKLLEHEGQVQQHVVANQWLEGDGPAEVGVVRWGP